MNNLKIYLSGKMSGLTYTEYKGWRNKIKYYFDSVGLDDIKIFDPSEYYNYEEKRHYTEEEIMKYELRRVDETDILFVNLEGINTSVGTIIEVFEAFRMNKTIIGFGSEDNVHPWLLYMIDRIEENFTEACDYIATYLLDVFK